MSILVYSDEMRMKVNFFQDFFHIIHTNIYQSYSDKCDESK